MGFTRHLDTNSMLTEDLFGHPGAGGSLAFGDLVHQVGFGYVMNSMGNGVAATLDHVLEEVDVNSTFVELRPPACK